MSEDKLQALARKIGHRFINTELLRAAITHRSRGSFHNERLEFLGDAILNFIIAQELYDRFPKAEEGELTRLRAKLVRGETLADIARDLSLGEYLQLGPGELKSGGMQRDSILADALEAIIGALFLEGDLALAKSRLMVWFETRLNALNLHETQKDAKTRLQEYLQAKHLALPEYQIIETEGDPHHPIFKVECRIPQLHKSVYGVGNTRRKAEQAAAEAILESLNHVKK